MATKPAFLVQQRIVTPWAARMRSRNASSGQLSAGRHRINIRLFEAEANSGKELDGSRRCRARAGDGHTDSGMIFDH